MRTRVESTCKCLQMLIGNNDTNTAHLNVLESPFLASKVRLLPFSDLLRSVCLRLELYGCAAEGKVEVIVAIFELQPRIGLARVAYQTTTTDAVALDGVVRRYNDWPSDTHLGLLLDGITGVDPRSEPAQWLAWSYAGNFIVEECK